MAQQPGITVRPRSLSQKKAKSARAIKKPPSPKEKKPRKRPLASISQDKSRPKKMQKTGHKSHNNGANPTNKTTSKMKTGTSTPELTPTFINLLSDDEDGLPITRRSNRLRNRSHWAKATRGNYFVSSIETSSAELAIEGEDEDIKPNFTGSHIAGITPTSAYSDPTALRGELQKAKEEITRLKCEHAVEVRKFSEEKESWDQEISTINGEKEAKVEELEASIQHDQVRYASETNRRNQELRDLKESHDEVKSRLENEEWKSSGLERELEEVRTTFGVSEKRGEALEEERDKLTRRVESEQEKTQSAEGRCYDVEKELNAEKDKVRRLQSELVTTRLALQKETDAHQELMKSMNQDTKSDEVLALKIANTDLTKELESLKFKSIGLPSPVSICGTTFRTPFSRAASLAPSNASPNLDEQTRIENIRKAYMKVKSRYEILRSIAFNLTTSSRGLPYDAFGDFGKHLRQIKTTLEEYSQEAGGTEKQRQGSVVRETDRVGKRFGT